MFREMIAGFEEERAVSEVRVNDLGRLLRQAVTDIQSLQVSIPVLSDYIFRVFELINGIGWFRHTSTLIPAHCVSRLEMRSYSANLLKQLRGSRLHSSAAVACWALARATFVPPQFRLRSTWDAVVVLVRPLQMERGAR